MDHLYKVNNLIEKCNEFNINLHMAFIDYEKAFDTIEMWKVLNSMMKCRVDTRYIKLIENIYSQATAHILLWEKTSQIPINRGVRQGDTIFPALFITSFENIFREINWLGKGTNMNCKCLNHLQFADDILLISNDPVKLQEMTTKLD